VATVFSYSSGGAGGVFAPALFMGGMLGGVIGHLDVLVLDHESRQIGAFALVGMGAVFAGVVRAPITSVLIIFEMTGGYGLVLPLMLANMISFILARKLRPTPIYEALLHQDGINLPRPAPRAHPAEQLSVSDAMTSAVVSVTNEQSIRNVLALVAAKTFALVPVVGESQTLLGAISVSELRRAKDHESVATLTRPAHRVRSDEPLVRAVIRMNDLGTRQLLVVDAGSGTRLVGVLSMSDVVRAYASAASGTNSSTETKDRNSMLELRVETLMLASIMVPGSLAVAELAKRMRSSGAKVAVVRLQAHKFRVLLPEQINEFARDEELEKMLVAEDLALEAPTIAHDADIRTLLGVLQDRETETAIVLGSEDDPVGVVTKNVLARAFYEKYGLRLGLADDPLRSS
jgi:CBS domain-containing protein